MKRLLFGVAFAAVLLVLPISAGAGGPATDGGSAASIDQGSALVLLNGEPLATYEKTRPAKGKKIDFSSDAVKSYRAQLSGLRNDFKSWLRANAPKARVNGQFDIALNGVSVELNGTQLATLRSAPMVVGAELQGLYRPLGHEDPDLALVHALEAWSAGGGTPSAKGQGVKVAIVDTGIDATHPCFDGMGDSNPSPLLNNKVISAAVFYMKNQRDKLTPADVNGHGTHVAGTVACDEHTAATVSGVTIPYEPSGVAPAAQLGNFNVFPGEVGNARSEDIVDALEAAYEQGFDVANMSLGGGSSGFNDLLAMAVDNLDQANMVIAVAAGNSGPGFSTIESPGKAARALTAGAYTVGHFVGAELRVGSAVYGAATGDFATVDSDLTAPLGVALSGTSLSTACTALPAGSLAGKIGVISRGTCTFSQKIRNAQDAGALAAIVVNNVGGDPTAMGLGGIPNEPTIPAYMVALANRDALIAANGQSATITGAMTYFDTGNDNIMAGFSSQGPTDVDFRVKPDVTSPGVNVLSSQPAHACGAPPCWAFFQGTSMATPHLAGIAAVVRAQHPSWSAAEIRSAIVNTADQGVLKPSSAVGTESNVNVIGAGRANAFSATTAGVALDPVSVSFGAVPSGSGQSATRTIAVSSLGGSATNAVVTGTTGTGVTYGASVSGNTITVTMTAAKRASAGGHQATLRVFSGGTEIAHAAVYTLVK
ncbi:MAG: S8 family serine peptidase [Gaiellaceae bacterium]